MTPASFNKGATLIALRPVSALAGRSFAPGDVVPWRKLAVPERRVGQLIDQRRLAELSQDNFDYAIKQRSDQDLPKGHTEAGLEALGIRFSPPPAPATPEMALDYDSQVEHRGYRLCGRKVGRAIRYDLFTLGGQRLNPGNMLPNLKLADAFLDHLEAEAARLNEPTSPDTAPAKAGEGGGDPAPAAELVAPLIGDDGAPLNPPDGDLSTDLGGDPLGGEGYGED